MVAAEKFNAAETVDPRPFLVGKLQETFAHYPKIGTLLPAMGYGDEQVKDLEETINNTACDVVIIGTPIDLRRIIDIKHPSVRVTYDLEEISTPTVADVLQPLLK
jgi:predicted GTPase